MPTNYSLGGTTTGLPKTKRGSLPYEIDALSPREVWGAGNGSTTLTCRQLWEDSATWIKYMVGEAKVTANSQGAPSLKRHIPEVLRYNDFGDGADTRKQFCMSLAQVDQGGRADGENMSQAGSNWPEVDWCRYQTVFEALPYKIRSEDEVADIVNEMTLGGATAYIGARELLRYIIRSRKTYTREQPIPAASTAGGFKVIDDAVAANRRAIGQVGFRSVSFADVSFTWIRVPVGWPPPIGWTASDPANPWPPKFNPVALGPLTKVRARDSYLNKINDDYFDVAAPEGYAFEPGTLLYTGYDDSYRYDDAAGDHVMDIVYNFKWKEGGWNKFLDARGNWVAVSVDIVAGDGKGGTSAGRRPYETANFNNLFGYA